MVENLIALAVPVFITAVIVESWIGRRRGLYRAGTSLSDLGAGIVSVVADAFLRLVGVGVYAWVFAHYRVVTFEPESPWPWVIGVVGVDFIYYWWHRLSHVINAMWAVHVVHHHSEDFNYAVALRQPALEATSVLVFYLPLAMLGVPPLVYLASYAINLFYQFWVHTELVGRLGPLEWIFNTPSHHRVHHGINPKYLDRNYGGILIVWDRLFGSFQEEEEPVVYGVTKPLRSYNPLWANVEYWATMWDRARAADGLGRKLRVLVAHPAWRPGAPTDEPVEVSRETFEKYDPATPDRSRSYIMALFVTTLLGVGAFFVLEATAEPLELVPLGALIMISIVTVTGFVEQKRWARPLDWIRQAGVVAAVVFYLAPVVSLVTVTVATGVAAASQAGLWWIYRPAAAA